MPERGGDANDERPITVSLRDPVVDVALTGATSSHSIAAIGQSITIAATVANNGNVPLAVPVSLFVDPPTEPDSTPTPKFVANTPVIQPGASETVDLIWDTAGLNRDKVGEYPLLVAAEVPGDVSDDNNEITLDAELFHSAFQPDSSVRECVDDVSVELAGIYDHVDVMSLNTPPIYSREDTLFITYRIFNYSCDKDVTAGLTLTGSVSGTAINDQVDPCLSKCPIPAGGMTKRFVTWQLLDYPVVIGEMIEATVSVRSPAEFTESDATNNAHSFSEAITVGDLSDVHVQIGQNDPRRGRVANALLLAAFDPDYPATTPGDQGAQIAGFVVVPADLVIGSSAIIYAYVLNRGDAATTIPVALHVDDDETAVVVGQTETVQPGEFQLLELTWRIPANLVPGSHTLTVSVSDPDLAAATGAERSKTVMVREPEFEVNIVDVSAPGKALVGGNITVSVVVQNIGPTNLKVQVELLVDSGNAPVNKVTTVPIEPGETRTATLVWDSPVGAPAREYLLRVRAGGSEQTRTVTLRQPNIALSLTNLVASPSVVILGKDDKVTVSAALRNTGETAIVSSVALYLGDISAPVSTSGDIAMDPGETSEVELEWHLPVDIEFGDYLLRMVAEVTKPINSGNDSATGIVTVRGPYTDAELISVVATPSLAYVGEPVWVDVTVLNPENSAANIPLLLEFPGESRRDERRNPSVRPHQSVTRRIEWRTGDLASGTYTLRASAEIAGRTITAATAVTLQMDTEIISATSDPPNTAMRGQPVTILVQVRNNGRAAINVPVELTFPSSDKAPERRSPRVLPGATETVNFVWKTGDYSVGEQTLRAALIGVGNVTEGSTSADVRVELTLAPLDAEILSIASNPANTAVQGQPVEILVQVRNNGPVAIPVPIELTFPSADKAPERRSPRVLPGATETVNFVWKTGDYSVGEQTLRATLTGVGNVTEGNTSADVRVELTLAPVDAEILSIASNPANTAVQGQPVEILVQVRNNGPVAIPVPIELTFPSADKAPERRSPRVLPGATETVNFVWKTGDYSVGEQTLRATLTGVGNVTEGNTSADVRVELTLAPLDAEILSIASNPADTAVQGQPVEILVQVRNNGPVAIPVPIELTFPSPDKAPERRSPRVLPGATETVNFVWKTGAYSVGEHTLRATLTGVDNVTEGSTSADVRVELTTAPVDAEILSIASNPANTAVQGQPVEILVQVRNNGPVAIPVPIELTFPSPDKAPELRSPRVLPGATETVNFVWKTGDYSVGEHTLWATLTGVGNVTEGSTSADVRVELTTAPVDAEILSITSNPANTAVQGQPVEILVQVRNNGPVAIPVPIELTFPSADKAPERRSPRVLPGATETVNFVWKTGDYSVGEQTLRATLTGVDNVTEGNTSADVRVELTLAPLDAEILSIASNPADTAVQGQPVEILVQVRNNGPVAIPVPIELTFPSPDKAPERRSPRVLPGATETVNFVWKTGDYSVGEQTLRATLTGVGNVTEGNTSAAVRVELTLAPVDAEILSITSNPANTAVQGQPVEILVQVRNNGPVAIPVPIELTFPSPDKAPERRSPRVLPGATETVNFVWKTGDYSVGEHTLWATLTGVDNVTEGSTSADVRVELTTAPVDAEILSIASNPADTAVQGQPVEILVQVRNNGPVAIPVPIELTFPSADKAPERRSPRVLPGATETVNFVWKTGDYSVGEQTLWATLTGVDNVTEGNTSAAVRVELTLAPVDAEILSIASNPANTAVQGQPVEILVQVRNNGPVAIPVPIELTFPSADKAPERRSPRVLPDATETVNFVWKTGDYSVGEHTLRATLTGVGNVTEGNTSADVRVELTLAPVDAEILSIASNPANTAVQGQPVEILVQVRNNGRAAINVPLELTFPSADKAPERRSPRVDGGGQATAAFVWNTSNYPVGVHTLRAALVSDGNITTGRTADDVKVELTAAPLAATITRVWSTPDAPMVGTPVAIMVAVRNDGPVGVNVPITLHYPSAGKQPETRRPRVGSGETGLATFEWLTGNYRPGTHSFRVVIGSDVSAKRVFELTLAQALLDRGAAVRVELARAPLAAAIANISSTPDAPMVGTPVEITVAVHNDGPVAVNVPVILYFPSAGKQPETRRPRVAPGETAMATFQWRTGRYTPGTHSFRVVIPNQSPGDPPLASQVFNLVLLAPLADFAVENITVPDIGRPFVQGEWIPIAALVRNLGPSQGRGTLTLEDATDATHLAEMYQRSITLEPGESRRVEFTWKSLRYDPGVRHLRVVADGDYDPTHHNNRTQLATVALLPNQDIIIGFGDDSADALVFKDASPPALQTTGDALDRIVALSAASYQAQTFAAPELGSPILAAHVAVAGRDFADTAQVVMAMHRLHQAANQSAHHCSDLQRRLDNSHPRAVLCPAAPALLR